MLRNIRKIGYTILSRHFYIGIGVGFFLASLFYAQVASADTIALSNLAPVTNAEAFDTNAWVEIQDAFVPAGYYVSRINMRAQYGGKGYNLKVYAINTTSPVLSTTVGTEGSIGYYYSGQLPVGTCNAGCWVNLNSDSNQSVWHYDGTGSSTVQFVNSNSGYPAIEIYIEPMPVVTASLLNFSFTNGNVASSSCSGTSTSSICIHYYYPNFTPLTPVNLLVLFITFLISFIGTGYIIRKLT